jgi:putative acyl-CoA dehydrogenase
MARSPESLDAWWAELETIEGGDSRLDAAVVALRKQLGDTDDLEVRARSVVESMALVFGASLLVRHAPHAVADAFCSSRFGERAGRAFGTLPSGLDLAGIVDRARPIAS